MLTMPWIVWALKAAAGENSGIQVLPVCAAMAVAYGFGEGLGRLACISFGCCYGKPLSQVHPLIQKILNGRGFVFSGETKKNFLRLRPGRPKSDARASHDSDVILRQRFAERLTVFEGAFWAFLCCKS